MLKHNELAFIKAIYTFKHSLALLKELWQATARRKKSAVPAGRRSTISGSGAGISQQLASKRKTKELVSSGGLMQSATRRPAPGGGSASLPTNSTVMGEQVAVGSRQPLPSG